MRDNQFIAVMAIIGLLIGLGAFQLVQNGSNGQDQYCEDIAQSIRANQSFDGTVGCYPPGVLNVGTNESENVVNQTELQCVCRRTYNGNEQIFTIRKTR